MQRDDQKYKAVVFDLDGTALNSESELSVQDRVSLTELRKKNIIRIAATGRSVFSFEKIADQTFPIDYLIYSCGSGIISWPEKKQIFSTLMQGESMHSAISVLKDEKLCFQVHEAIPNNHRFHSFIRPEHKIPEDYIRRCRLYKDHIISENMPVSSLRNCNHIIAITDREDPELVDRIKKRLPALNIIRATSPLDHRSMWIEIYPENISKGTALKKLAEQLNICTETETVAVGNDYNDLDFLNIAARSYMVSNAPENLKKLFEELPSNNENPITALCIKQFSL